MTTYVIKAVMTDLFEQHLKHQFTINNIQGKYQNAIFYQGMTRYMRSLFSPTHSVFF